MIRLTVLILALAFVSGCSFIQDIRPNTVPAYDGKIRDSGIIGVLADNQILVTGFAKGNYDWLIKIYGDDFLIPLTNDACFDPIPGKYYHIKDKGHPGKFILYTADPAKSYYEIIAVDAKQYIDMCDWYNSGIDPEANDPHKPQTKATSGSTTPVKKS